MVPSGAISDSVLYACLEKDFVLEPGFRKQHSILFYARFRDDILMAVNAATLDDTRLLLNAMKKHAEPFVLTLDSVSKSGFEMLDVKAEVLSEGFLSFSLFKKTSSIWTPLSPDSLHSSAIHRHWPMAQVERIRRRFTCPQAAEKAVREFEYLYNKLFGLPISKKHQTFSPRKQNMSWLVLPYHRCLVEGKIGQVVRLLSVPFGLAFDMVGLSWSLNSRHLVHRLRTKLPQPRIIQNGW